MKIICGICRDALTQEHDVFHTMCGHIFHHLCLITWLARSKTCPECRRKVTESRIYRLYFNFTSERMIEEHASSLQERIDNLKFNMLLKDKEIQHNSSKVITLKKQNSGLRQEVLKLESDINRKKTTIHALENQIIYFKEQCASYDTVKKEVAYLQERIEKLQNIETLLKAPIQNVKSLIKDTDDPTILRKYISILKKEFSDVWEGYKHARFTIRTLKKQFVNKATQKSDMKKILEKQKKLLDKMFKKIPIDLQRDPNTVKILKHIETSLENIQYEAKPSVGVGKSSTSDSSISKKRVHEDSSHNTPDHTTLDLDDNNKVSPEPSAKYYELHDIDEILAKRYKLVTNEELAESSSSCDVTFN